MPAPLSGVNDHARLSQRHGAHAACAARILRKQIRTPALYG